MSAPDTLNLHSGTWTRSTAWINQLQQILKAMGRLYLLIWVYAIVVQSTKSAAKKQQLREDLLRVEQQIQSEKALRKKREMEKAAKVRTACTPSFIPVLAHSFSLGASPATSAS